MPTQLQNFYKTTITRNWSATTGDFNVSTKPTISSGWLVVSPNNTTLREIIKYTATGTNAYGDFITVSNIGDRGLGGTTAQTHTIGESVRMNITAQHWADLNADISAIVAAGAPDATTTTRGLSTLPIIETTTGVTHSLTTVVNQKVIVWAKGDMPSGAAGTATITLKYNGVTKDTAIIDNPTGSGTWGTFSLMYTEIPGTGTHDITVTANVGSISDVVIIVMKIPY